MDVRSLLLVPIAVIALSTAGAISIDHDKPSLNIEDGCHPYPAVNTAGETSGGLKGTGRLDGGCKGSDLGSQVYGRAVWYKDLWAIIYSWYFPKVMREDTYTLKGHRHKWVSAVVWLDNPAVEKPNILAVSAWAGTNTYSTVKNGSQECGRYSCTPDFAEYINGTIAMLSRQMWYHYISLTVTTKRGVGEVQDLIMWEQLTNEARTALSETDFGVDVKAPFIDANLNANLEVARPFL
ncbi:unnamed protein product [Phytophthora fragariaefolia]|uniref:Unnamed protein product n=1 Tax=Phytophthora fragariaefolia TaxID=1490495 RepID=A0A9W6Y746_9STRA|nr:unnamed protein product [Phytophthora fragariaefolia]